MHVCDLRKVQDVGACCTYVRTCVRVYMHMHTCTCVCNIGICTYVCLLLVVA